MTPGTRYLLTSIVAALIVIFLLVTATYKILVDIGNGKVRPSCPLQTERVKKIEEAMKYHGTDWAFAENGTWYFWRDGMKISLDRSGK